MILKRWYGDSCLTELYLDDHVEIHDGLIDANSADSIGSNLMQVISLFKLDPYLGNLDSEKSDANLSKLLMVVGDKLIMHESPNNMEERLQMGKDIMAYISKYISANKKMVIGNTNK